MITFKLEDAEYIRLCDLLKTAGLCDSGGQAKAVIADGQVKVDQQVELRKRCKITAGQSVEFAGELIEVKSDII